MKAARTHITFLIQNRHDPHGVVTEILRYASVLSVGGPLHAARAPATVLAALAAQNGFSRFFDNDEPATDVTLHCPAQTVQDVWARQNVERIRSFGHPAVAWRGEVGSRVTLLTL